MQDSTQNIAVTLKVTNFRYYGPKDLTIFNVADKLTQVMTFLTCAGEVHGSNPNRSNSILTEDFILFAHIMPPYLPQIADVTSSASSPSHYSIMNLI
jgi:hypothetical protein